MEESPGKRGSSCAAAPAPLWPGSGRARYPFRTVMHATETELRLAELADLETVVTIRRDAILALAPRWMTAEAASAWALRPDRGDRCRASIEAGRPWVPRPGPAGGGRVG